MGGGKSTSTTTPEIPEELKPIYSNLSQGWVSAMKANPMKGPESWYSAAAGAYPSSHGSLGTWQAPSSSVGVGGFPDSGAPAGATPEGGRVAGRATGRYLPAVPATAAATGQSTSGQLNGGGTVYPWSGGQNLPPEQQNEAATSARNPNYIYTGRGRGGAPAGEGRAVGRVTPVPPAGGGGAVGPGVQEGGGGGGGSNSGGYPWPGASATPGGWVPSTTSAPLTGGDYGFWAPLAKNIAGPSSLEDWAAGNVTKAGAEPASITRAIQLINQAVGGAGDLASGAGISSSPAITAAKENYWATAAPQIETRNSLMGLGRSGAVGNDLATGWASTYTPLVMDQLAREQNAINARTSAGLSGASQLAGIGGQETSRLLNTLGEAMNIGGVGRGIAQSANDAQYEDLLRRQGLWENLWLAPFGQASANTIGQKTTSNSGLFK